MEKLEGNARWIEERREKIEFAPSKRDKVDRFLQGEETSSTPLGAHLRLQKKLRDQKRLTLEKAVSSLVVLDGGRWLMGFVRRHTEMERIFEGVVELALHYSSAFNGTSLAASLFSHRTTVSTLNADGVPINTPLNNPRAKLNINPQSPHAESTTLRACTPRNPNTTNELANTNTP